MSFILEALKKSENKHRQEKGQNPPTIHEPIPPKSGRSRTRITAIVILLLVNTALLLWFFAPWQQSLPPQQEEVLSTDTAQLKTFSLQKSTASSSAVPQSQKLETNPRAVARELPVPRNENKIYNFNQLPIAIQRRIPPLQMSLHAYHRDDNSASMVQLNDRIMRTGDKVTDNISLEQITAEGVVLRYDGYRFLLPRRGNQ
ncbi:MAG: general secretion pathway protein GspB [Desulfuromusa sp.]|nr:general secretion pathway protein GspB [Desulfuromusa sp.]